MKRRLYALLAATLLACSTSDRAAETATCAGLSTRTAAASSELVRKDIAACLMDRFHWKPALALKAADSLQLVAARIEEAEAKRADSIKKVQDSVALHQYLDSVVKDHRATFVAESLAASRAAAARSARTKADKLKYGLTEYVGSPKTHVLYLNTVGVKYTCPSIQDTPDDQWVYFITAEEALKKGYHWTTEGGGCRPDS